MNKIKEWTNKWSKIKTEVQTISEQQRAEKQRKKLNKLKHMKNGTRKTFLSNLYNKNSPMSFMKEEYIRRKNEREKKYKEKT